MSAVARRTRRPASRPAIPAKWRQRIAAALLSVVVLGALYMLWLRDSSLVQVHDVTITGLSSDDAPRIRAALEAEATEMTTLHVRRDRLDRAVEGFPVVRAVVASPDFPNGLRIHVVEHNPAAVVESGHARMPVAADGSILRGVPVAEGSLPVLKVSTAVPADRVRQAGTLALLRVAAAAPDPFAPRIQEVGRDSERGIVVTLEDGPELVFGEPARTREKWAAALRVLADGASQGATYVDVRIPERPAAGGVVSEQVAPEEPTFETPDQVAPTASTDPTLAGAIAPAEALPAEPQP